MYNAKAAYRADIDKLTNDFLGDFESDIQRIISEHADKSDEYIFKAIKDELCIQDSLCDFLEVALCYMLDYGCCRDCWSYTEAEGRIVYVCDNFDGDCSLWEGAPAIEAIGIMAMIAIESDLTVAIKEQITTMIEDIKKVRK